MAPISHLLGAHDVVSKMRTNQTSFRSQWSNPGDVFNVLLILGGDVVGKALAQLVGGGLAPVAFSFGWVGYSVSALVSAVGDNRLMPITPDCRCKVINGRSGHAVENTSWILGRMVRDYDKWMHDATAKKMSEVLDERWKELRRSKPTAQRPDRAGLVVTVYEPRRGCDNRPLKHDRIFWTGILTTLLQIGIAAIPFALFGDWSVLLVTACGICLAFSIGFLPQWRKEKWACRLHSNDTYVVTRGNGSQHVVVILSNGNGLNLEDLAAGQNNMNPSPDMLTRGFLAAFCIMWLVLLITASGIKLHTWFLLAVGAIGMLQNIAVAGSARQPETFGINLRFVTVVGHTKVMKTLMEVENRYPKLGRSMLHEFFPAGIHDDEKVFWNEARLKAERASPTTQVSP